MIISNREQFDRHLAFTIKLAVMLDKFKREMKKRGIYSMDGLHNDKDQKFIDKWKRDLELCGYYSVM